MMYMQILQKEHGNTRMTKETPQKISKYIKVGTTFFSKRTSYGSATFLDESANLALSSLPGLF